MRILLTGVSGFIGSALAPTLLAEGHHLVALARDPARVQRALEGANSTIEGTHDDSVIEVAHDHSTIEMGRSDSTIGGTHDDGTVEMRRGDSTIGVAPGDSAIEVVHGDVLTGEGLTRALAGVEVAYYLIHSMEHHSSGTSTTGSFAERDRLGASTFARHARRAGVGRIVYLGGLQPRSSPASPHLASRAEVERILFEHVPGSVAMRASIVIGARSRPFRVLVRLVERMPVLTLPAWRRFRTQPIDVRDMVELLAAAARLPEVAGRTLDVGGPQAVTYQELLQRIAELLLLRRPALGFAVTMTPLTAHLVAALTDEQPELVRPLMESLDGDLLAADDRVAELLEVHLHSLDAAIECALREWEAVEPLAAR